MNRRTRRPVIRHAFVACVVGVALAACSSSSKNASPSTTPTTTSGTTATANQGTAAPSGASARNEWSNIPAVARQVEPSIVTIQTSDGLGSGVIWSSDGVIATVAHVVGTNTSVQVVFADGRRVSGTVIATDSVTDVAAVRADRKQLPAATFDLPLPALGDLAIALGSPLGFTNSVTAGVVSGLGRSIPGSASETQSLVDLIQTDAAISPGNSGGALVNGLGHVMGLSEAYIPPSEGAVSLGFAIPSHNVSSVMKQLLANGKAVHAYLGLGTVAITSELQQQLGLSESKGALVQQVSASSPGAKAGLESGDVVVSIGNVPVASPEDLIAALRDLRPGETVKVTYVRDGATHTTNATVTDRPSS
jgi:S1-C subfamily serine protease